MSNHYGIASGCRGGPDGPGPGVLITHLVQVQVLDQVLPDFFGPGPGAVAAVLRVTEPTLSLS